METTLLLGELAVAFGALAIISRALVSRIQEFGTLRGFATPHRRHHDDTSSP